jgi:G3E family GTPase
MRIPSVPPKDTDTSPEATAIRAVSELCDIDDDEYYVLSAIPPVKVFSEPTHDSRGDITLYLLYAVQPPPSGPLEDQDQEDEDDLYDWYTWPRALDALTAQVGAGLGAGPALRTIACALAAAAQANRIPRKWGGVFGQEFLSLVDGAGAGAGAGAGEEVGGGAGSKVPQGTGADRPNDSAKVSTELSVTIVGGELGSGKTSAIKNLLLTQRSSSRVAVVVNTCAGVNTDAAVLQQMWAEKDQDDACDITVSVFEVNEACACCWKGSELVPGSGSGSGSGGASPLAQELGRLAASGEYDYCLVEAAGGADLSLLVQSLQGHAGAGYLIDSVVLVVDGSRFSEQGLGAGQVLVADVVAVTHTQMQTAAGGSSIAASATSSSSSSSGRGKTTGFDEIRASLLAVSPYVDVVEAPFGAVDPSAVMHARKFQHNRRWSAEHAQHSAPAHAVTFRAHRPFHPSRLEALLRRLVDVGGDRNDGDSSNTDPSHGRIVRLKGIMWLAPYADNQIYLSFTQGQGQYESSLGVPWWASVSRDSWPSGLTEAIAPLWKEPYGDRQVELVVFYGSSGSGSGSGSSSSGTGNGAVSEAHSGAVAQLLAACLVTDEEFAAGQDAWNELDDPFSYSY